MATERMTAEHKLVEALRAKQVKENLSDREMAGRLQVSRSLWTRLRLGDYHIKGSTVLLQGITQAFPELSLLVLSFLAEDVQVVNSGVTTSDEVA